MNQWYDSQKKPNRDFRKSPQERLDRTNPRRAEFTAEEKKRLAKLEKIAVCLKRGENVQNCQLQTWLTEDEYTQIGADWEEQLALPVILI